MADRMIRVKIAIPVIVPTVVPTAERVRTSPILVETITPIEAAHNISAAEIAAGMAKRMMRTKNVICLGDQLLVCLAPFDGGDFLEGFSGMKGLAR